MIEALINDLGAWSWFILGLILLGLEVVVSGTVLLWFGLAAFIIGGLSFLLEWSWQVQLIAFGVLSVVLLFVGRRFVAKEAKTDQPFLNDRAGRYIGQELTLSQPIVRGVGRVKLEDTTWRVLGPDCPAGTLVRVCDSEAGSLVVEPV